jgi:FtsH-binding integral membrane protein
MNDLIDPECTVEAVDKSERDTRIYRVLLCTMMGAVVWLAASVWFVISIALGDPYWISFVWAVPIASAVVMRSGKKILPVLAKIILSSVLCWTLITSIYLHLLFILGANVWMIFFIGLPLEAIIILMDMLKRYRREL